MNKNEMAYELVSRLSIRTKGPITPYGKRAQLYCPFHNEKNASMFVDMQKGIFHCFSCRRKGTINALCKELTGNTIYKFLDLKYDEFQEYSKPRYSEVVDYEKVPEVLIKESDKGESRASRLNSYRIREINSFLRKRGIDLETANQFKMFYTPTLVRYNGTPFFNRVCIPIYEKGKLLSIEGRSLEDNPDVKVMYPKGSSVSTLFEYEKLNKDERLYIVEGLMDLAFLRRDPFFKNSSCIFGANITPRQKHLLKKFKEVVYIKENDEAGIGCVNDLKSIEGIEKGYLKLPQVINNIKIKDAGDIVKTGYDIKSFRIKYNWLKVGLVKLH